MDRPGPDGPGRERTGGNLLGFPDVCRLKTFRSAGDLELDLVTLGEALEAIRLDGAEVDEHVLPAVLGDKAIPLRIVEPLHLTLSHVPVSSCVLPPPWRGCPSEIGGQTKTPRDFGSSRRRSRAVSLLELRLNLEPATQYTDRRGEVKSLFGDPSDPRVSATCLDPEPGPVRCQRCQPCCPDDNGRQPVVSARAPPGGWLADPLARLRETMVAVERRTSPAGSGQGRINCGGLTHSGSGGAWRRGQRPPGPRPRR